tara:strand:+ start:1976 stop:2581 length:606 start_codon:yes stop_codon:yes gene_type:complete
MYMLFNLLSSIILFWKNITTPRNYKIVQEELEYNVDYNLKYHIEDDFWEEESKDWDGILDNFYVDATRQDFRYTAIPQCVEDIALRIKYYFNGHIYSVITEDLNYLPGHNENPSMHFSIPLTSAWIVDHDDKPKMNITHKVRRYAGPRGDFHGQAVPLRNFLYFTEEILKSRFPKIILTNSLGMKKTISTLDGYTTNLQIP